MFQDLPVEVIQQIIAHLPSASSIVNLGLTNRSIHGIISEKDYESFRPFVQRAFPTIRTTSNWRDVARVLTSRSRAWDRKAFMARECCPPLDNPEWTEDLIQGTTIGYQPSIDSYESWPSDSWSSRKEVLAWGAAGRLRTRTIKDGISTWSSFRIPDDHRQELDILDVRLLLPHQHENSDGESIILRRANGEVVKVQSSSKPNAFAQSSRYIMGSGETACMDVSKGTKPLLAMCDAQLIQLYPINSPDRYVRPTDTAQAQETSRVLQRKRCAKFLSDTTLAVASQFLQGRNEAPISVYDISPTGLSTTPLSEIIDSGRSTALGRHNANVIAPLDSVGSTSVRPGRIFISGWTDGKVRLHDLRLDRKLVAGYVDVVDDGQILSLLPIGHEKFVAGSHQNGCLKTFDLRMLGARAYSYLDARPVPTKQSGLTQDTFYDPISQSFHPSQLQRDINIFLTPMVNYREKLWEPLSRQPNRRAERYRGSIYSLSSPSPTSPTIYAGISNHVIQLDFLSTDDIKSGIANAIDPTMTSHGKDNHILNLSCYERPRRGHESTDPVLLRKQMPMRSGRRESTGGYKGRSSKPGQQDGIDGQAEDGWDERWRLEVYDRSRDRGHGWG